MRQTSNKCGYPGSLSPLLPCTSHSKALINHSWKITQTRASWQLLYHPVVTMIFDLTSLKQKALKHMLPIYSLLFKSICVCVCVCVWLTNVDIRYLKKNEIKIEKEVQLIHIAMQQKPIQHCKVIILQLKINLGTFLVVQCLSLHLPMQKVQVQSLVEELRSHVTHGQKIQTDNRSNIIINSIEA